MASKALVLRNVIDDLILNRVGAATESDELPDRFEYHGASNDEGVATEIRENPGRARLFSVEITASSAVSMFGSTLQSYDVPLSIVIGYPTTTAGQIAALADWAAILAKLNNGSWTATGLQGYQTPDEPAFEIAEDEWMWLVITTSARIETDL